MRAYELANVVQYYKTTEDGVSQRHAAETVVIDLDKVVAVFDISATNGFNSETLTVLFSGGAKITCRADIFHYDDALRTRQIKNEVASVVEAWVGG